MAFRRIVLIVMAGLVLDAFRELLNGAPGQPVRILSYIVNIVLMVQYAMTGWMYNYFIITQTAPEQWKNGKLWSRGKLFFLPTAVQFLLAVLNIWTGWFFTLDAGNRYAAGPFNFLQMVVPFFYLFGAGLKLRRAIWLSDNRQSAQNFHIFFTFIIFPAAGGILSAFFNDAPFIWPMCVISLLFVFASLQKRQISSDGLTGMNNRAKFDSYLADIAMERTAGMRLYLFLMDVNSFKTINDRYGHYEGDQALRETAEILKSIGRDYDVFLARYGGDEFAIIADFPNPLLVDNIRNQIRAEFSRRNETCKRPYDLSLSIGVAEYPKDGSMPLSELIAAADRELYADKSRCKSGHMDRRA